ncbi:LPS export ABC transporter periplasmic protein LptC [Pseudocolwellia agarivorans]|uniref:LPS export ABC transporter periplasmic protein LptC n=1 Tax=Pseudocolwellia agarivorans TaxID=1911682 RepID=UPI003F88591F
MNRLYSIAFVALLIACIAYGLIEWKQSKKQIVETIDTELAPDFIAESLKSNTFNETGALSHIIDAQRMEHYSGIEVTHFEFPSLTLYPENKDVPWKVSSKEGTLFKNNRVSLKNRVKLESTDPDSLIQQIHGKSIELDLNTNIISSEQAIVIIGNGFTVYGSGLIVDINTKKMTLTEHVQTIYQKTQK